MYPQPSASKAVTSGREFWRLNTLCITPANMLGTPGDIYEVDASLSALVLGPESDFSQVQVTYYDDLEPDGSNTNSLIISPERPMTGLLNARMDAIYPTSKKKGRILLSVADIFDRAYIPSGGANRIQYFPPRLDVLGYFNAPPSVIPERHDRIIQMQYFQPPSVVGQKSWVIIPFYGRRYAYFNVVNRIGAQLTLEVRGITFSQNDTVTTPTEGAAEEQLVASMALADNAVFEDEWTVDSEGMFDCLAIAYSTAANPVGPAPTRLILSDKI